jgi:nicotinate-nucleotide pyrophosphorylase (carboxylating)
MKDDQVDPIGAALAEDVGGGDITSESFVPEKLHVSARIIAREKAILAGVETAADVFRRIDPSVQVEILGPDGSEIVADEVVLHVRGLARSILTAERVALNFLQRLSGIATLTRQYVDAAEDARVKILDTRKTTPGLRALEKAAVVAGGGSNHRSSLSEMVLVKDNHLVCGGGVGAFVDAVRKLREERPGIRIEVEADRLDQVRTFLKIADVDVILLDNMKPAQLREAVALGKDRVKFEASGGVTLKNIRQIAATGVDYVSVGALTHSARAIDFSLEISNTDLSR